MDKNDYIFGIRAVIEAIEAGRSIDKVLVRRDLTGDLARELFAKVREYDIVMQRVPQEKLNRITMKNHRGAIALLSPVEYQRLEHLVPLFYEEGRNPLVVVLDGLTDTRNFGAIGRTAACAASTHSSYRSETASQSLPMLSRPLPEDCFMCRYAGRRIHFRQ